MTWPELCGVLEVPLETPPGELLAAWDRRRSEIGAALTGGGQAKPVKMRLRDELRNLEAAADIAPALRQAAEIDGYLAEFAAEAAKPAPIRGVLQLCLERARAILPDLAVRDIRFACEKRLAEASERLAAATAAPTGAPGSILELAALPSPATPRRPPALIRLVARPHFTLGRSEESSFPARFQPETEETRQRTSTISRINTTLFLRGQQIWVQDGQLCPDGAVRPSLNGTLLDNRPLARAAPLNLAGESRLQLGQYGYDVRAVWLPPAAPAGPAMQPAGPPAPPKQPGGCIRFTAAAGSSVTAIWILTDAAFGSGPGVAIRLDRSLPAMAWRFHLWRDRFWLEAPRAPSGVLNLDGRPRAAGEILELQPPHELNLGPHQFRLRFL